MAAPKKQQTATKLYKLVTGFVKQSNVNWDEPIYIESKPNLNVKHEWDASLDPSLDPSVDDYSDDDLFDSQELRKHIIDLIFVWYFGKQDIKILFLDVDGVLNTMDDCMSQSGLNKELIGRLSTIINKTNCKIVLSSDWRLSEKDKDELFMELRNKGNMDIEKTNIYIGDTPIVNSGFFRALEIEAYLKDDHVNQIYNITSWCAVDDRNLIDPLGASAKIQNQCFKIMYNHFVHTNEADGLLEKCMNYVIAKLTD